MKQNNAIVHADIRSMATLVLEDEKMDRQQFLSRKKQINSRQTIEEQKCLRDGRHRLSELETLNSSIYEDEVRGKIPEDVW